MKNILLLIALGVLLHLPCCKPKPSNPSSVAGSADTPATTIVTTTAEDTVPTIQIPPFKGWVNDYDNLFTDKEEQILDSLISNYEKKTTIEIAIATIDSTMATASNFDYFTLLMANKWGVGKEDKKNGILVAIAPSLQIVRIQNGYGIEEIVSNEETQLIIYNVFLPRFEKGKFYEGTKEGIIAIMNKLNSKMK